MLNNGLHIYNSIFFWFKQCISVNSYFKIILKVVDNERLNKRLNFSWGWSSVIWIITLLWHTNKTRLQANVLGRTPVSFTDTLDTARFNAPVFQQDVSRLVLFKCTMFSITTGLCNKRCKYIRVKSKVLNLALYPCVSWLI